MHLTREFTLLKLTFINYWDYFCQNQTQNDDLHLIHFHHKAVLKITAGEFEILFGSQSCGLNVKAH